MTSSAFPTIETAHLLLRVPAPGDVEAWAAYVGDPEFLRYLPRRDMTAHQLAELYLNGIAQAWEQHPPADVAWVITLKHTSQLIGWSGAGPNVSGNPELVYMLGKPYWGQGFATEAAGAVVRYGFENQGWDHIEAAIIPGNVASRRVLEHLGFVYEKDVNYYETSGDTTIKMDSPMVPCFALRRDRFVPTSAFYQVTEAS